MSLKNRRQARVVGSGWERQEDMVREVSWVVAGRDFGPRSQASLQKAQGPGVCKLPKPPASRALCQAKRARTVA